MGLDISAYSKLVLVAPCPKGGEDTPDLHVLVSDVPGVMHSGIEPGLYRVDGDEMHFRAGSYSGYNMWRAELCQRALGIDPRKLWEDPDKFAGKPFVGLINFSDCEGSIGGEVARKLSVDFENHRETMSKGYVGASWFFDYYEKWLAAFAIAADSGVVRFH